VELYARVRRAVRVEGRSQRAVAREFRLARKTLRKIEPVPQIRPGVKLGVLFPETSLGGLYCPRVPYSNVACWMQADAKHGTVLFAGAQQQGEAWRSIAVQRFQAHRHTVDRAWRSPRRRGRDNASPIGSESRIAAQSSSTQNRLQWRCAKVARHQCHSCRSSC
jgi:hypothetical protein